MQADIFLQLLHQFSEAVIAAAAAAAFPPFATPLCLKLYCEIANFFCRASKQLYQVTITYFFYYTTIIRYRATSRYVGIYSYTSLFCVVTLYDFQFPAEDSIFFVGDASTTFG